jgi:hypothetical protein
VDYEPAAAAGLFKLRAPGSDPAHPQCLQLQDNRLEASSPFWLWNCSTGADGSMDYSLGRDRKLRQNSNESFCVAVAAAAAGVGHFPAGCSSLYRESLMKKSGCKKQTSPHMAVGGSRRRRGAGGVCSGR